MILRMPAYCRDFRCSAEKCSDNCCIGWEIDIDSETADCYMNIGGDFGKRLKNNIRKDDCYSFILDKERCPFLNENNLCDIILNLGEDKLCYICDNHPRYYEWFDGMREGGVGLCCEEAALLILENGGDDGYWDREVPDEENDDYDKELYSFLHEAREKIFTLLRDRSKPLSTAVYSIALYAETIQFMADNGETDKVPEIEEAVCRRTKADREGLLDFLGKLEPIDDKWISYVDNLKKNSSTAVLTEEQERYLRNIGIYFIWRYFMKSVFDYDVYARVKLALMSMAVIGIIFRAEPEANIMRYACLAKNYSKEIEYSEENLQTIYDMAYTDNALSAENLAAFF